MKRDEKVKVMIDGLTKGDKIRIALYVIVAILMIIIIVQGNGVTLDCSMCPDCRAVLQVASGSIN